MFGDDTSTYQGLILEMLLTAVLIFAILMLAVEKHRATSMAPVGIGLTLFVAHLVGMSKVFFNLLPWRLKNFRCFDHWRVF
jgi:aquaporin related protein